MKHKNETKIGQSVWLVRINIHSSSGQSISEWRKEGIIIKQLNIVHQTDYKIALNDEFITLLDRLEDGKRKSSYQTVFEDVAISFVSKETYFPNGIFAHAYTLEKPEKFLPKMKKQMLSHIEKEYGFLSKIDIDSLKIFKE